MMNVMLDLETWGTRPGAALRSVGACTFDPYGTSTGEEFYMNISRESCLSLDLHVDPDTEAWWKKQSLEAQRSLERDQQHIDLVVDAFHNWFKKSRGLWIWGQGSNFDPVLWEAVAHRLKKPVPWKFWDTRDTRTAYEMAKLDTRTIRRKGTYHNALDDAKHQALCVQVAFSRVRVGGS